MPRNPLNMLNLRRAARLLSRLEALRAAPLLNILKVLRASRLINGEAQTVLFVTSLLRAREIKMALALRRIGWKVVLIYIETTPFQPGDYFDVVIRARTEADAHAYAKALAPRICHVFSGAVDGMLYRFCGDKPGPVVIDLNDIFCSSLFDYCHERFEPTRECLEKADGLCARDLQAKSAERLEGFRLPRHTLLFPEYSSRDGPHEPGAAPKSDPDEVRVVSVGTFCLEKLGMYDSGYLQLARMLTEQRIHLHIYPHWFYLKSMGSSFNWDMKKDFADFLRLQEQTDYLHVHESLPLDELARVLPQYDFGIIAGGSLALGQTLKMLKPEYMRTCYSGRISDYLDARLPVLINHEVGFNYWLLKRYGLAVGLEGILRPGFREQLLAIKRDRQRAARVDEAARKLSLDRNVARLVAFYNRIVGEDHPYRVRLGYPLSLAKYLPLFGNLFQQLESAIQRAHQAATDLRNSLETEKNEGNRKQVLLEKQQKLLEKQQQTATELRNSLETEKNEGNRKQVFLEKLRKLLEKHHETATELRYSLETERNEGNRKQMFLEKQQKLLEKHQQTATELRNSLETEKNEGNRKQVLLEKQQKLLEKHHRLLENLQWRLEQTAAGLHNRLEAEKGEGDFEQESLENPQLRPDQSRGRRSIVNAKLRLEVERGSRWADELSGLLNWPEIRDPVEQATGMPELLEMIRLFAAGSGPLNQLSSCWQVLSLKNFSQLLRDGYRNFKRTVGCSYFNFLVQDGDPQIAYLESQLDGTERRDCLQAAADLPDDPFFDWHDQRAYRYFVLMLWNYVRKADTNHYLDRLEEPDEGNPLVVPFGVQRASQDLANSLLEYYSMSEVVEFEQCKRVLEIGGGYGRNAYVILALNPHIQYTLVDIPPALWVAQRYLSSVCNKMAVFGVRDFQSYEEVREEMERASIVCLLPHQLELLPDRRFDLSLNISSFGEMQPEQIKAYFEMLERLTKGHFYMKQWKVSQNAFDHLSLTEENYPVSRNWSKVYSRTCRVQTGFFEALYRVSGAKS